MTTYVIHLNLRLFLLFAFRGLRSKQLVYTLDPENTPSQERYRRLLLMLGHEVQQPNFFAGHMSHSDNRNVFIAARRDSSMLARKTADRLMAASPWMAPILKHWGKQHLYMRLCALLEPPGSVLLMRLYVAAALTADDDAPATLIIPAPYPYDLADLREMEPRLNLKATSSGKRINLPSATRLSAIVWAVRLLLRPLRNRTQSAAATDPAVMVLASDPLGMDRSLRGQPFWMLPGSNKPDWRTIALETAPWVAADGNYESLDDYRIERCLPVDLYAPPSPIQPQVQSDLLRMALYGLCTGRDSRLAANTMCELLYTGNMLASYCYHQKVKAFMAEEMYLLEVAAMAVVGPHIGTTTIGYQYSNMAIIPAIMACNFQYMLLFSDDFKKRHLKTGGCCQTYLEVGYTFASSIPYVKERAATHRRQLAEKGVQFVIGFFDESVRVNPFQMIHADDHLEDLETLAAWVLANEDAGLVVKTQFTKDTPNEMLDASEIWQQARDTGRVLELAIGTHRNLVLPMEAALASDVVLGHRFGATASLEAALVGCRSLLLERPGEPLVSPVPYEDYGLVYHSIDDILAAVERFRESPDESFGDWSPFLDTLLAYRDDKTADRVRKLLDQAVKGQPLSVA